jgi:hypothetical protein
MGSSSMLVSVSPEHPVNRAMVVMARVNLSDFIGL